MTSAPTMSNETKFHRVYTAVNRPLTILGIERRRFFLAAIIGAATFNFSASVLVGISMFVVLFIFFRQTSAADPELLRIILNSSRLRRQYDPAKRTDHRIEVHRG
jgi:type IV secretory pathway VirB3-like protein